MMVFPVLFIPVHCSSLQCFSFLCIPVHLGALQCLFIPVHYGVHYGFRGYAVGFAAAILSCVAFTPENECGFVFHAGFFRFR